MDDLISRQAGIDMFQRMAYDDWNQGVSTTWANAFSECADMVEDIPSADVQPVRHGHWIIKDNPGTGWYRVTCSECGEDVTSVAPVIGFFPKAKVIWDFCPECGTRMDGD